ncbi:MAG TPA: energy transducer TonB [Terriglobales bacterium]|nr:energy transducer TonB [Terriglobales bacterium]
MFNTMFSTLESTWDQSARRGWTTLASFTMQAFGMSLLLAIPLIWVQQPPQLQWLQPLTSPAAFTPPAETQGARGHHAAVAVSNPRPEQIVAPQSIPLHIAANHDGDSVPTAPDFPTIGTGPGRGSGDTVPGGLGDGIPMVIPARPAVIKPLRVSNLGEGNLIYRVQPNYPSIARQARVQGTVELRAIISKAGTIENLVVVRGHPMLAAAAIDAVRQWRYRPYLLNNEPIEVETEITVNFVLSGS